METENYILCIGEEEDDCSFMSQAISSLDPSIKVRYEYTGNKGISYLTETYDTYSSLPKLIVIDLEMPGMNGKEMLARIRKIPHLQNIPVLFLSNNPEELDEQFLEKHHVAILRKPFTMDGYNKIAETIIYSLI
ncbi:MAG TPA: response regulator [Chitinophagaceae bacterium]|nr:response regulator [Chitinophagaceae bacterium]